jgi:4-amino-4-deoxy-L-arabinose transferase-like glycosyltransferase
MIAYLFLGLGIWCFYYAWRGIKPPATPKSEVGKPLGSPTRTIYWAALFIALGLLFLWEQWLKRLSAGS